MAEVLYTVEDKIGHIVFNRPRARNAFTFGMYERLRELCSDLPMDGSVRVLVLTGAGGRAFAAGTEIGEFKALTSAADAWAYQERIDAALDAVERCPIPTIAAIAGACTGAGASVAAACDLRIASSSLAFGFPIARTLGNGLSARSLARVADLVGPTLLRDLIFQARLIGADEARRSGLVTSVAEDADGLRAATDALARQVAGHAPLTLRATKEALRRLRAAASDAEDRDLVALCYTSRDFREGLDAFLAKRRPQWQGH